eukprot:CAMPEP_0202413140 /NCGR_PEP_ID=MMETSP1128-20130828/28266_1 /ASSEMBLY_ACC=CAM_ASM_000463 /TAXON_ID=3047 /ORGANISM="Dunaliella tertiolecta, Strain CCMP1320" /LENGTH=35 /DNA_ID= /DNA_START= /DNA_END= /DNA_ORIENTATION=
MKEDLAAVYGVLCCKPERRAALIVSCVNHVQTPHV